MERIRDVNRPSGRRSIPSGLSHAHDAMRESRVLHQPYDLQRNQQRTNSSTNAAVTHVAGNRDVYNLVRKTRFDAPNDEEAQARWDKLYNHKENQRLLGALKDLKARSE